MFQFQNNNYTFISTTIASGLKTNLFLCLWGFEREISKKVDKLGSFAAICRELRPDGPCQFQKQLLLRFT